MINKKKIVIIGATSAIAEHCARLWVNQSIDLTLVGRDVSRCDRVAADLKVRSPGSDIRIVQADFLNPVEIQEIVKEICEQGVVDVVLIAHGLLPQQDVCQNDLTVCYEALKINGMSPVLYAEAFVRYMEKVNIGTLALIGSVAGDRGRKSNYVYGAAKGLVERYAQGLQHRLSGTKVKVVLIKPGPTDTPMTASMKARGAKLASVESVAKEIVLAIDNGISVVYTPKNGK